MNCKICEREVNEDHAILVEDKVQDDGYYVCSLTCFMQWLVNIGETEDFVW